MRRSPSRRRLRLPSPRATALLAAAALSACAPGRASLDPGRALDPEAEIELVRLEFSGGGSAVLLTAPTVPSAGSALEATFVVRTPAAHPLVRFEAVVFVDLDGDQSQGQDEPSSKSASREGAGSLGRVHRLLLSAGPGDRLQFRARAELAGGEVLERSGQLQNPF